MVDTAVQLTGVRDMDNNESRTPVSTRMSFSSPRRGATVSFHSINYSVKMKSGFLCKRKLTQKKILIELKPGLNAILGPTGSGKSSFLDVLAARKDPAGLSGEVLIDGAPQPPNFKCLSGYVVQNHGGLKCPSVVSFKILQSEGPFEVVGTQLIRGVSGGERKRTNIGMELIIDPPVLFLDEPTTGLDASTANSVLMLLKRMANSGRTIILSIHQPLTLLVGGRMVYHGLAQDALDYFNQIGYICEPHNNPADFFLDVVNGESTAVALNKLNNKLDEEQLSSSLKGIEDRLVEEYKNSTSYKQTKSEQERIVQGQEYSTRPKSRTITYSTSSCHQFNWVLRRTFKDLMLNPQTSFAQVSTTIYIRHSQMFLSVFELKLFCVIFIPMCACVQIFSGLLVNLPGVADWLNWLKYFSIPRYGLAALEINEFTGLNFCDMRNISSTLVEVCSTGEDFLSEQGIDYSTWGLWQNHLALGIMTLIFLIIAYLKLRFIKKFT
uniref:ATP-binding cassette, sub-family G (WHITE), member 2a n=1 Tax=Sinocyclocheilus anshuiensis TaxID=1608454 RepID=A0A671QEB9_9TELE